MKKKEGEEKMPATTDKRLGKALESISQDLGLTLSFLTEQKTDPAKRLSTGSLSLDLAMGGGWVHGRVHEVYGPEQGGKTMLALLAISQAQKMGLNAAFIDVENTLDPVWAQTLGVDIDKLIFTQPNFGEQALNAIEELCKSGKVSIIVLDSIAALVPKSELEGEIGDAQMGAQARMMGQALRKISPAAAASDTIVIFINQLRQKIGVMFGNPETTPGGNALKFYASIRLDVRKESKSDVLDGSKNRIGHSQRIKVVKNKTAPPFREAAVPILYASGLRVVDDTINAAQAVGLLDMGTMILGGKEFGSLASLHKALSEDSALLESVRQEVLKAGK